MLPGRVLALWLAHVAADELCKFEATLDGRMVAASKSMRDIARSDLPGLATRFVAELGDPSALSTHACPINDRSCIVPLVVEAMEEQWERCRKFNKCAHVPSTAAIASATARRASFPPPRQIWPRNQSLSVRFAHGGACFCISSACAVAFTLFPTLPSPLTRNEPSGAAML